MIVLVVLSVLRDFVASPLKNHSGYGKNYVRRRKNYIRHNPNHIRPFFSTCKLLGDKSLCRTLLVWAFFWKPMFCAV